MVKASMVMSHWSMGRPEVLSWDPQIRNGRLTNSWFDKLTTLSSVEGAARFWTRRIHGATGTLAPGTRLAGVHRAVRLLTIGY
jgi:hypothetical protein